LKLLSVVNGQISYPFFGINNSTVYTCIKSKSIINNIKGLLTITEPQSEMKVRTTGVRICQWNTLYIPSVLFILQEDNNIVICFTNLTSKAVWQFNRFTSKEESIFRRWEAIQSTRH